MGVPPTHHAANVQLYYNIVQPNLTSVLGNFFEKFFGEDVEPSSPFVEIDYALILVD